MITSLDGGTLRRERYLDGPWQVGKYEGESTPPRLDDVQWVDACVPGAVHYDLVRAGLLRNPFGSSSDASAAAWVADSDWVYRTSFAAEGLVGPANLLVMEGVDTYSDVWLNGRLLGTTANNYRSYAFPLDPGVLEAEVNTLIVHVKAHRRMAGAQIVVAEKRLAPANAAKSVVRRYQRSFYSNSSLLNLGTDVLGIGVNRPVRLVALPALRVADVHFHTTSVDPREARAIVEVSLSTNPDRVVEVRASLMEDGCAEPVARASSPVTHATAKSSQLSLSVPNPRLWWPAGYGDPYLYTLRVEVRAGEELVDLVERRVGIRVIELVERLPSGRKTFQFVVNGQPVYVRGFNLVPLDYIKVHADWEAYEHLFELISAAGANMVRIWGGGSVEAESFYDACDERGIMLWQDFFLHSAPYPDYDEAWVEELRLESSELVCQLRSHPCLSLLCGGNETQQGWDEWGWQGRFERFYGESLVCKVLPEVARTLCPEVPYIDNSPHGGKVAQSPLEGDMHCWGNFYNATKDPVFVTETCWNVQSYSRPATLLATMDLRVEDYEGLHWPERWKDRTGLDLVTKYPYTDCFESRSLAGYLDSLEVEQAEADRHALKMMRARSSSCTGIVWWPLNKGGPLFEFGCVDYLGTPLMSYYVIRRLYAETVVALYLDVDDIRVVGSNVGRESVEGVLQLCHLDTKGAVLARWQREVTLPPGPPTRLLDLDGAYRAVVDRSREVINAQLLVGDRVVAEDTLCFCPLAELEVEVAPIEVRARASGDRAWTLEVETSTLVKLLRIESDQKFLLSDNYFTMVPGKKKLDVRLLDRPGLRPPELRVSALGVPVAKLITLPQD